MREFEVEVKVDGGKTTTTPVNATSAVAAEDLALREMSTIRGHDRQDLSVVDVFEVER